MCRFIVSLLIVCCVVGAASVPATAFVVKSGNAAPGNVDPLITVRGAECTIQGVHFDAAPVPLQQASVLSYTPRGSWNPPPSDSKWISIPDGGRNNTVPGGFLFETAFSAPEAFLPASMTMSILADNRYSVYLNGYFLGESEGIYNFWGTHIVSTTDLSHFRPGGNLLQVYVSNDYDVGNGGPSPMGVAFSAQVEVVPVLTCDVRGRAILANYVGDPMAVGIPFEIRRNGSVIRTGTLALLDPDGSFIIPDVHEGPCSFSFKPSHWLRRTQRALVSQEDLDLGDILLTNGDADGDNAVTPLDLSLVKSDCGARVPPGDPNCDIDGNGHITGRDAHIVKCSQGLIGDE